MVVVGGAARVRDATDVSPNQGRRWRRVHGSYGAAGLGGNPKVCGTRFKNMSRG
jgi:hypothetical protein